MRPGFFLRQLEDIEFQSPDGEVVDCDLALHMAIGLILKYPFQSPGGEVVVCDDLTRLAQTTFIAFQSPGGEVVVCDR